MNQLISVIIALYNKEKYIEKTIQSVLDQTYTNLEIIVVDDGSQDSGTTIVESIIDSRIKLYRQSNRGPGAAQNFGFRMSCGLYIKFLDGDDILTNNAIENQLLSIHHVENSVSFLEWEKFHNIIPPYKPSFNTIHKDCLPIEYLTLNGKPQMLQSGQFLIPRDLILKAGLWKENLSLINDTEFYTRLFLKTNFLKFSEKGKLYYRVEKNTNSISQVVNKRTLRSAVISVDECAKNMLNFENTERVKQLLGNMYQMILEWSYPRFICISKVIEKRQKVVPKKYWTPTKSSTYYNLILSGLGWKFAWKLRYIFYKYRS
jgi:glycosyltransferase involved in cell wall biosynthesis